MSRPLLDSPAWCKALTLSERLEAHASFPNSAKTANRGYRQIQRWQARFPFLRESILESLTVVHDAEQNALVQAIGQSLQSLSKRTKELPAWLLNLNNASFDQRVVRTNSSHENPGASELVGFLELVRPFIEQAHRRLRTQVLTLCERYRTVPFEVDTVLKLASTSLPELLLPIISRTLVLELNVRRLEGKLQGDNSRARFQSFCEELCDAETAQTLLREYPVLARQVVERLTSWVSFYLEFLDRLCSDWHDIRRTFTPDVDPGLLSRVQWNKGDRHRQGRQVIVIEFTSGLRLVYKPRKVSIDVHFQELLVWLNERGMHPPLPTLKVVDRGSYGWVEFIAVRECDSADGVARFYKRQGAYLVLLYLLEATDFHLANLIAGGEYPFLVDLETLFHPRIKFDLTANDPASAFLASSVLRVGMLPYRSFSDRLQDGVDVSGLGGFPGQKIPFAVSIWDEVGTDQMRMKDEHLETTASENRPTLNGQSVEILNYAEDFVEGFASTYRLISGDRNELLAGAGPLMRFSEDETRVILRPTMTYSVLRQTSYHPDVLRDALDRDVLLGCLWLNARRNSHLTKVLRAELEDLRNGDIPMFLTRPDSVDLWTSSGQHLRDYFAEPALTCVCRKLKEFSDVDLERQLWLIRASIAAAAMNQEPPKSPRRSYASASPEFDRDALAAAAVEIGYRLKRTAIPGDEGAVSWLGLTLTGKQNWSIAASGPDLYDGLSGITLFLSYLSSVCGDSVFMDLARATLKTIRNELAVSSPHTFSIGAFDGLGGIIYLLTHMARLWADDELLAEANGIVKKVSERITYDRAFDIVSGSAGCLACILALHRVAPSNATLQTAITLGEHLLRHEQPVETGSAWTTHIPSWAPLTGFSHGASGIGWALLELSEVAGKPRFRSAALRAFDYERSCFSSAKQNWPDFRKLNLGEDSSRNKREKFGTAWCHGAAGITLARLRASRYFENTDIRHDIDAGLLTTLRDGFGRNHSLCHGDWGNLEVLIQADKILGGEQWRAEVETKAATLLKFGKKSGWLMGVPLGVESPGLMTGLSGVGLGLLRAAYPAQVPSVLLLDPPSF